MKSILSKLWLGIVSLVLVILIIIWFFQVILLDKFYIKDTTDMLIERGEKIAEIFVKMDDDQISTQKMTSEITTLMSTNNTVITIVDKNNKILFYGPKKEFLNRNLTKLYKDTEITSKVFKGEFFDKQLVNSMSKTSFIVVGIPIKDNEKIVGSVILSSAIRSIKDTTYILKKQVAMIAIVSLVIATFLAFFLAKLFIKPLLSITETSKQIAKGDFSARVSIDSKDEIGVLGDTINDLAIQLGQIEKFRREFIANTSHELKTPLSLIRAYAELVKDIEDQETEDKDRHLQVIIDESIRLNKMVEDILYLSQMEAGYYKPVLEEIYIVDMINNVIKKLSWFALDKNIEMILEIENEEIAIYAENGKMYQVLFNVINNSITNMRENGRVIVKVKESEEKVRIEVQDDGIGIPKEELPYIWDRFYKVDKSRQRNGSGTGLGMNIVKNILEAHDFEYGIESELNIGTLFWIEIKR